MENQQWIPVCDKCFGEKELKTDRRKVVEEKSCCFCSEKTNMEAIAGIYNQIKSSPVEAYQRFFEEAQKINQMLYDKGYTPYQCCQICCMADRYWHMVMQQQQSEYMAQGKDFIKKAEENLE